MPTFYKKSQNLHSLKKNELSEHSKEMLTKSNIN